jgi:hypothetical protein
VYGNAHAKVRQQYCLEKWSGQLSAFYDSGRNSGGDKTMSIVTKAFALAGVIWTFGLALGLALDIRDFDRTKGGYEPPYEGVTGEPIDWASLDLTPTGLVKRGYVYIAQPPLYKITRRKKEQYVQSDRELSEILIRLGADDVVLRSLHGGNSTTIAAGDLTEILHHLEKLNRYAQVIRGNAGSFVDYLAQGKDGVLPEYLVQIRQGNDIFVEYFLDEAALRAFSEENPDLDLFPGDEADQSETVAAEAASPEDGASGEPAANGTDSPASKPEGPTRRARVRVLPRGRRPGQLGTGRPRPRSSGTGRPGACIRGPPGSARPARAAGCRESGTLHPSCGGWAARAAA